MYRAVGYEQYMVWYGAEQAQSAMFPKCAETERPHPPHVTTFYHAFDTTCTLSALQNTHASSNEYAAGWQGVILRALDVRPTLHTAAS